MSWKQAALDAAEVVDAWRLIPRIILLGYGWILWESQHWFFSLEDPSAPQSVYVSVIWGAGTGLTGWYFNTGRRWG